MILKVLTRHNPSYASLIDYITRDSKAPDGNPMVFTHNLRGEGKANWTQEFLENEASRKNTRSNQIYLYHEIISFSDKENTQAFTKEVITDLAEKYMSLRGNDGLMIGAVHTDKNHLHLHFCTSGTKYRTGLANRLSRTDLQDLKVKLQEYHREKYPELDKSICEHGKGNSYVTDREWQTRNKGQRTLLKDKIRATVRECFANAQTQQEFLTCLQEAGLHHYERNGVPAGIAYDDAKIRFSRLDISKESIQELSAVRPEGEQALTAIRQIRQRNREQELSRTFSERI
jgi:REP element-mobilizing transposase RayT